MLTPLPARKRGHVTFGCFNNALKINAATVARWAEIMRAVPNARLLVKGFHTDGGLSRGRLNDLLTGQGIAPERFDLRAASPTPQEHFAAYGEVDVALDTAPYNGTATTCEAMWSGVPTVALRGDRHAARVGASLMAAAGLRELVAESPAEYVAKAVGLAGDLERLATLRATLRERMRASPLTDAATFARAMEAAYRTMWRRWCGTGA